MPTRRALLLLGLAAASLVWWSTPGFVEIGGPEGAAKLMRPNAAPRDHAAAVHAFLEAEQARSRGASAAALALYEKALAQSPRVPLFLGAAARTARELGSPERAVDPLRQLEKMGVLDPAGQAALIAVLAETGDFAGAEQVAQRALARNPFDALALEAWRAALARSGNAVAEHSLVERLRALERDPDGRAQPLRVLFDPPQPVLHIAQTRQLGAQTIYDHSEFLVTLHNPTRRPIVIDRAELVSMGTGSRSGLGDVTKRFSYPLRASREIAPDGMVDLDQQVFGFKVDTPHVQVTYVFQLCWHGLPAEPKQCVSQHLDLLPPQDELP